MSRTDKDMPWWVIAEWWEPGHWRCEFHSLEARAYQRDTYDRPCDLPAAPVVRPPRRFTWKTRMSHQTCVWIPVWPTRNKYNYTRPPTRDEIHLEWWGPDRAGVRGSLKSAAKEYRAAGEVDTIAPVEQHRHAPKGRGWWD